jgi:Tetratricopeptide repeat
LQQYEQALQDCRGRDDRRCIVTTLCKISESYLGLGLPQKALKYYNEALAIQRDVGD